MTLLKNPTLYVNVSAKSSSQQLSTEKSSKGAEWFKLSRVLLYNLVVQVKYPQSALFQWVSSLLLLKLHNVYIKFMGLFSSISWWIVRKANICMLFPSISSIGTLSSVVCGVQLLKWAHVREWQTTYLAVISSKLAIKIWALNGTKVLRNLAISIPVTVIHNLLFVNRRIE